MNQEQLVAFCKEIIKLKEQLKCPICLDIIEETADLQCNHRLCNDCYSTQKINESNECPLCKTTITRRSLIHKDEFANILGSFLSKICNKIETAKKLTIEEIVHYGLDEPLITKKTTKHTSTQLDDKPSPTYSNTSLPKKRVFKPLVKDCCINKSPVHVRPSTSQEDPFDKLIKKPQGLWFNKKGSRIKYKRKKDKQEDTKYKILDFQNDDMKNAVIQWLNDNRNKFNRLTQTQCHIEDIDEPKEVYSMELPSVSQKKRKNVKSIDIASNISEKINKNDVKMKKKVKTRAKSLDLDFNKSKKDASRLSDFGLVENYNIEESNTEDILKKAEENVLLNIIEDQYLNKLENELQKSSKKIEQLKAELNNKENESHSTLSSASGWRRIENISKTLRKKGKRLKKLNITLQSSQHTNCEKLLKVHLKNDYIHDNTPKNVNLVPKDIEMEDVSASFHKKALETDSDINPHKKDLLNVDVKQSDNIREIKDVEFYSVNTSQGCDKENINKNVINTTNHEQKVNILSDLIVHREVSKDVDVDPYSLPTQKLNISNEKGDQKIDTSQLSDSYDSISELSNFGDVMKHLKNNLETCLDSADKTKNLTKRHIESIKKHLEKLNDFYTSFQQNKITTDTGTQTVDFECQECTSRMNNKQCSGINIEERRGIDISTNYSLQDMESQCNITDLLVHGVSQNLQSGEPKKFEDRELEKKADEEVQSKNTQNNDFGGFLSTMDDKGLQKKSDAGLTSKKTQNDDFGGFFSTLDDKELGKISLEGVKSIKKTQNDYFADSLDLLNFETQALEKQYLMNKQAKSPSSDKPILNTDEIDPVDQNDVPPSAKNDRNELICSLKSDCSRKDAGNVSTKRALSDSDSSDIVVAKKRCNRFIRDDLSIEFDASEKPNFEKTERVVETLLLESDGENDEEYLDSIIKKYNDPKPSKTVERQVEEDCLDIVAQVKQNVEILKGKSNDSNGSSYKTASPTSRNALDDDNLFLNDHNLSKLDSDIRMNAELKNYTCDVITETENFEPSLKRFKSKNLNTAFDRGECPKLSMAEDSHPLSPIKNNKGTFCPELEDSFDGVDFENILMDEVAKKSERSNMVVGKSNEDDLFSDEDVVDTTPQKQKSIVDKRSPTNIAINLSHRFPVLDNADNGFDAYFSPLAPPPGFEDDNDETPVDITIINVEPKQDKEQTPPRVTPEKQLENTQNKLNCTALTPLSIQVLKMRHSTPYSQCNTEQSTLGLSPIVLEKNLFERALDSHNTIVPKSSQDTPRKKNSILTSDPKQKSILNYVKTPTSSQAKQKPCIACTRLSKDQTQSISLLTNKKLATYSAKFNDTVTHMVVSVDDSRKIKDYTMKFVSAVASGIWVLGFEWVQECLKSNAIVPEEPYEAFDDFGGSGPKIARLTRQENPLFKDYKFYCVRSLYSITVEEVEDVVIKLGGIAVRHLENLLEKDGKIKLIITEGRSTQDFEVYEKWLEKYKIVTVDIEWLSRSVGRYKILSVRPYIWCSDDMLEDLGYPPYLIENYSSTLSEHM